MMALLGQKRRDWRVLYAPCSGKTQWTDGETRTSEGMDKGTALNYMAIFDDAVCIEKIKGRGKGKKIYKNRKSIRQSAWEFLQQDLLQKLIDALDK
jgi:hypothetical protein